MAVHRAQEFLASHSGDDRDAYSANFGAHKPGIPKDEMKKYYDSWAKCGKYEQDLSPGRYNGPTIAADFVARYFGEDKGDKHIIDIAAGTGFIGVELFERGFSIIDGLDPSEGMLEEARKKSIYRKLICEFLNEHRLPLETDTYDCAVIAGGMGEGHIPSAGLLELIRIVKKGGLICIVMREEYLVHVEDYKQNLETLMKRWENEGRWKLHSRTVVPHYSFDNKGVVFCFEKTG